MANANKEDGNEKVVSHFIKTVCLHDWWLVKDLEAKRVSVSGSSSREFEAVRVFTSAPIVKVDNLINLHTADGVCVCLRGFINRQRTLENGFFDEVFDHFLFGFPPYWEEHMKKCGLNLNVSEQEHDEVVNQDNMKCGQNASPSMQTPINRSRKESRKELEKVAISVSSIRGRKQAIRCSSRKRSWRELSCEKVTSVYLSKRRRKQAVVSPETMNVKCSRSGRVLLPPLEFWRNQIPVYDGNSRITGIMEMEEVATQKASGSKSEPQKRQNRP